MANRIGQQLGNYCLTGLLGKGGFAEVYLGEHIHLRSFAAIKVLSAQLASPLDVEDFRREAQIIAGLTHRHIIRVLDFDVQEDVPFLVMEYASRGSLRALHPRGQALPLPLVLTYVQQVAAALHYAHERKLIHRDVKPDNMLVHDEGHVVLSDFGIVTIAHSTSSRELAGMAGTPAYMAPEQMQGNPYPASDQYALAVTVYEWITGTLPFQGTALEVAMQHAMKPPASLVERFPMLSPLIDEVVLTALAKDPKQRFSTVQAFATAFEQAVANEQDAPTFVKPDNFRKEPLLPKSDPGSSGSAKSGIVLTPPAQSQPDHARQSITPPLETRPAPIVPSTEKASGSKPRSKTIPPQQSSLSDEVSHNGRDQIKQKCPKCGRIDSVAKVSAIVSGENLPSSLKQTGSISQKVLINRLSLSDPRGMLLSDLVIAVLLILTCLLACFLLPAAYPVVDSANEVVPSAGGSSVFTLFMYFISSLIAFGAILSFRLSKTSPLRRALWDTLYYCYLDDVVYVPGSPKEWASSSVWRTTLLTTLLEKHHMPQW